MADYSCPECGESILVRRAKGQLLIGLHRDPGGGKCDAAGKNLVDYRVQEFIRVVLGERYRDRDGQG